MTSPIGGATAPVTMPMAQVTEEKPEVKEEVPPAVEGTATQPENKTEENKAPAEADKPTPSISVTTELARQILASLESKVQEKDLPKIVGDAFAGINAQADMSPKERTAAIVKVVENVIRAGEEKEEVQKSLRTRTAEILSDIAAGVTKGAEIKTEGDATDKPAETPVEDAVTDAEEKAGCCKGLLNRLPFWNKV